MQKIDLAISPCPNDTFIFHAMTQPGFLECELELHLEDVEELNRRAIEESRHAISKLSFFAFSQLQERYRLLKAGGALGRGCGPLLLSSGGVTLDNLKEMARPRILIPGRWTTANLLLHLFLQAQGFDWREIEFIPTRYDRILPALSSGEEQLGVIIHEERFTFQQFKLSALVDLGQFWEDDTGLPIPLGCIVARQELDEQFCHYLEKKIRASLDAAYRGSPELTRFIKKNAQALDDKTIHSHIELYVNDYSFEYGAEGERAIETLLKRAKSLNLS